MIQLAKDIINDILSKYGVIDIDQFYEFYTKNLKFIAEQQLLNVDVVSEEGSWKSLLNEPLVLSKSDRIQYFHKPIGDQTTKLKKYFGTGKFGKELQKQYIGEGKYKGKGYKSRVWSVEHHLYLFFKDVLKNMPYKPNPTSNPEHEIEIRGYLLKNGFVGPRPNMDKDTKDEWYKDKRLQIGEFVEQPNGSTSHPDLWVQLSNMRLSIEAKSNQGYYPMYGKTPPPKETVYIFSSKKTKYPTGSVWTPKMGTWDSGRTTFTFGHQLLTNNIRKIMERTKKKIKLAGRNMDLSIDDTKENYSSVGLTSDVNIQHSGSYANYWLDDRNIEREIQVLSYNWLNPLSKCDTKVDHYICNINDILNSTNLAVNKDVEKSIKFNCINDSKIYTCMCKTHNQDFEQDDSFVNHTFEQVLQKPYMRTRSGKFYKSSNLYNIFPPRTSLSRTGKKAPKPISKNIFVCYMCLMKYYKGIQKKTFFLNYIEGVILVNNTIYYKCIWNNYPSEDWRTLSELQKIVIY